MQVISAHSRRLIEAASDPAALSTAYADFIRTVLDSPLWSPEHSGGIRIPWRAAREARAHASLRGTFDSAGLYLFGSAVGIPLYLGMTGGPLRARLRRYVYGRRSQCRLAVDYEPQLLAHGLQGFPDDVRAWYRRGYGGSVVRLEGAVVFARHHIERIWFTLLPISGRESVRPLERRLIPVAGAWNRSRGYPPLLNLQHTHGPARKYEVDGMAEAGYAGQGPGDSAN
jgi:hypothetical protein